MFQFAGFATPHLWIQCESIRESRDQRSFVNFPGLFADFHALHRLLMPRHPPCALSSLTTNIQSSQISAADALRTFFQDAPDRRGNCLQVRHIVKDAIYRYNQIVKDHHRPLSADLPDRQKSNSPGVTRTGRNSVSEDRALLTVAPLGKRRL